MCFYINFAQEEKKIMATIKEKAEELSTAFRKEQGDVGYSEQLSYKLGIEAGANYVLEEVEKMLSRVNEYKDGSDHTILYLDIEFLVKQLKK